MAPLRSPSRVSFCRAASNKVSAFWAAAGTLRSSAASARLSRAAPRGAGLSAFRDGQARRPVLPLNRVIRSSLGNRRRRILSQYSRDVKIRQSFERLPIEAVPHSAHTDQVAGLGRLVLDFFAQIRNVGVDDAIAAGGVCPHLIEELLAAEHAAAAADEGGEQLE